MQDLPKTSVSKDPFTPPMYLKDQIARHEKYDGKKLTFEEWINGHYVVHLMTKAELAFANDVWNAAQRNA